MGHLGQSLLSCFLAWWIGVGTAQEGEICAELCSEKSCVFLGVLDAGQEDLSSNPQAAPDADREASTTSLL